MLWEQNPVCCGEQKPVSTQPFAALALDAAEPCSGRASKRSLALPKFCRDLCLMSRPYGLPLVLPLFWLSGSVSVAGSFRLQAGCRPVAGLGLAAGSLHLEIQSAMFNAPGFGRHARNPNAPRGLRAPSGYRARALPPAIGLCLGPGRSRALSMSRSGVHGASLRFA